MSGGGGSSKNEGRESSDGLAEISALGGTGRLDDDDEENAAEKEKNCKKALMRILGTGIQMSVTNTHTVGQR